MAHFIQKIFSEAVQPGEKSIPKSSEIIRAKSLWTEINPSFLIFQIWQNQVCQKIMNQQFLTVLLLAISTSTISR